LLENVPRDSKMAALVAIVADAERHPGPCIVFTDYRDTADYIVDQLQMAEVARSIDSVVADRPPHETVDAVRRTMEENGVLVATTAACKGFDFGSAALVVHYDAPRSPAGMIIRMSRVDRLTSPPGTVKIVSLTNEVFAGP
jgi:ERCC4-related helicase